MNDTPAEQATDRGSGTGEDRFPNWNTPPAPGWRPHSRGLLGSRLTVPLLVLGLSGAALPLCSWWGEAHLRGKTRLAQQTQAIHDQASALRSHLPETGASSALAASLDRSLERLRENSPVGLDLGLSNTPHRLAGLERSWSRNLHPRLSEGAADQADIQAFLDQVEKTESVLRQDVSRLSWALGIGQVGFLGLALGAGAVAVRRARRSLLEPLAHLRHWAHRMRRGDLAARVPVATGAVEFNTLAADINRVGEEFRQLKENMEDRVQAQTEHLARKNESLEILYDVAASLNGSNNLEETLSCFLDRLMTLMDARAGTVRLLTGDGRMRLVASRGLGQNVVEAEQLVPVDRCQCGHALQEGRTHYRHNVNKCRRYVGDAPLTGGGRTRMVVVPLRYRNQSLGIYNLFVEADRLDRFGDEVDDLLESVAQHLGMAIEKSRLDQEARRLSIIEERTLLAGELHDSLAQNLASMRVAVKMLGQSLRQGAMESASEDLEQLESGLEAANRSLRELINSFRSRLDDRDLIPAIEGHVERFRRETGILTHFFHSVHEVELDADREVQAFHIVLEALANIRKHSKASQAWVILDKRGEEYQLRIEDNGVGIDTASEDAQRGGSDHFGLALMQERTRRLDGTISFTEGRDGGTQVTLRFPRQYRLDMPYPGGKESP